MPRLLDRWRKLPRAWLVELLVSCGSVNADLVVRRPPDPYPYRRSGGRPGWAEALLGRSVEVHAEPARA